MKLFAELSININFNSFRQISFRGIFVILLFVICQFSFSQQPAHFFLGEDVFSGVQIYDVIQDNDGNIASVAIFDLSGKLVLSQKQSSFSIQSLANGINSIVVITNLGVYTDKLVKN